ncbi:hypothetical protein P7K49_000023, partial [Saguinus oedipus]
APPLKRLLQLTSRKGPSLENSGTQCPSDSGKAAVILETRAPRRFCASRVGHLDPYTDPRDSGAPRGWASRHQVVLVRPLWPPLSCLMSSRLFTTGSSGEDGEAGSPPEPLPPWHFPGPDTAGVAERFPIQPKTGHLRAGTLTVPTHTPPTQGQWLREKHRTPAAST